MQCGNVESKPNEEFLEQILEINAAQSIQSRSCHIGCRLETRSISSEVWLAAFMGEALLDSRNTTAPEALLSYDAFKSLGFKLWDLVRSPVSSFGTAASGQRVNDGPAPLYKL